MSRLDALFSWTGIVSLFSGWNGNTKAGSGVGTEGSLSLARAIPTCGCVRRTSAIFSALWDLAKDNAVFVTYSRAFGL